MKNYYYNPKTRDLTIFDTESKEMLVLERIEGIRVLTSSEIDSPTRTEPSEKWSNHNWDPKSGKAKRRVKKARAAAPPKTKGKWTCKNCGEKGHSAKTCQNPPRNQEVVREEKSGEVQ